MLAIGKAHRPRGHSVQRVNRAVRCVCVPCTMHLIIKSILDEYCDKKNWIHAVDEPMQDTVHHVASFP